MDVLWFSLFWGWVDSIVFLWFPLIFFGLGLVGFYGFPLISSGFPSVYFGFLWFPLISLGFLWFPLVSFDFLWFSSVWGWVDSMVFLCFPLVLFGFQGRNKGEENPRKKQANQWKFKEAISSQNASTMFVTKTFRIEHTPYIHYMRLDYITLHWITWHYIMFRFRKCMPWMKLRGDSLGGSGICHLTADAAAELPTGAGAGKKQRMSGFQLCRGCD